MNRGEGLIRRIRGKQRRESVGGITWVGVEGKPRGNEPDERNEHISNNQIYTETRLACFDLDETSLGRKEKAGNGTHARKEKKAAISLGRDGEYIRRSCAERKSREIVNKTF